MAKEIINSNLSVGCALQREMILKIRLLTTVKARILIAILVGGKMTNEMFHM